MADACHGGRQPVDTMVSRTLLPERYERGCTIIHDERAGFGQQALHQTIESALIHRSFLHQVKPLSREPLILGQGLIDGVRVDAPDGNTLAVSEVLDEATEPRKCGCRSQEAQGLLPEF